MTRALPPPSAAPPCYRRVLFAVCPPSAWKTLGCGSHARRQRSARARPEPACYSSARAARARAPPPHFQCPSWVVSLGDTACPVTRVRKHTRAPGQPTHPLVAGLGPARPGRRAVAAAGASAPAVTPTLPPWSRRPQATAQCSVTVTTAFPGSGTSTISTTLHLHGAPWRGGPLQPGQVVPMNAHTSGAPCGLRGPAGHAFALPTKPRGRSHHSGLLSPSIAASRLPGTSLTRVAPSPLVRARHVLLSRRPAGTHPAFGMPATRAQVASRKVVPAGRFPFVPTPSQKLDQ